MPWLSSPGPSVDGLEGLSRKGWPRKSVRRLNRTHDLLRGPSRSGEPSNTTWLVTRLSNRRHTNQKVLLFPFANNEIAPVQRILRAQTRLLVADAIAVHREPAPANEPGGLAFRSNDRVCGQKIRDRPPLGRVRRLGRGD